MAITTRQRDISRGEKSAKQKMGLDGLQFAGLSYEREFSIKNTRVSVWPSYSSVLTIGSSFKALSEHSKYDV
jgi:hypothetical protein